MKCEESNENFEEALFQLRNTPRIDSKFSPNQLFFKRNVRDNLPSLNSNTKIEDSDQKDAERRKQKERMKYLKRRTDNRDIETKPEHKNEYKHKQETEKTYPRYNLRNKIKRVTFNPIIEYKY